MNGALVMLGELLGRATVLLVLVFLASWLLRRQPAGLRHQLWRLTTLTLVLLPLFGPLLPRFALPVFPATPAPAADPGLRLPGPTARPSMESFRILQRPDGRGVGQAAASAPATEGFDLNASLLIGGWLAGFLALGVRSWRARRRAGLYLRLADPADPAHWSMASDLRVVETDLVEVPMTVGALSPTVVVPRTGRSWPATWRAAAVAHERAHLRQRDPLFQLLTEVMVALYWFHPLAWRAARQLRIERELAADDEVLLGGAAGSEYARLLVALACALGTPPTAGAVVPLLTPAGLKARLVGILDRRRPRGLQRGCALILAASALLVLAPVATAIPTRRLESPRDEMVNGVRLVPPGEGFVVGRVIDASGDPVGDAEVDFILREGALRTRTDRHGLIRSPRDRTHAPGPEFTLYARKGRLAARKGIQAVPYGTTLPTTLALRPAHRVAGFVRGRNGQPVIGVQVAVAAWELWAEGPGGGPLTRTDRDGSFVLEGMLYGAYELELLAPWGATTRFGIRVEDRDIADLVVTMGSEDEPTARLRNEDGQPLTGVRVTRRFRLEDPLRAESPHRRAPRRLGRLRRRRGGATARQGQRQAQQSHGSHARPTGSPHRGGLCRRRPPPYFDSRFYPYWRGRRGGNIIYGQDTRTAPVMVLRRPAQVSALVRFQDGTPAQARVVMRPRESMEAGAGFPRIMNTNASGQTQLLSVPPGRLEVVVVYPMLLKPALATVDLAPGEVRENVAVVLPMNSPPARQP